MIKINYSAKTISISIIGPLFYLLWALFSHFSSYTVVWLQSIWLQGSEKYGRCLAILSNAVP
jgi:hypothetical protein